MMLLYCLIQITCLWFLSEINGMQILVCLHRREASQSGYFINRKYDFAGGNSFRPINFLQLLLIFFPMHEKKIHSIFDRSISYNCYFFSFFSHFLQLLRFFFPCMGKKFTLFSTDQFLTTVTFSLFSPMYGKNFTLFSL